MNSETPLRLVRKKARMTIKQVSDAVGIDMATLSRIERGGQTTSRTAEALVAYFGSDQISEMEILYPERYSSMEEPPNPANAAGLEAGGAETQSEQADIEGHAA